MLKTIKYLEKELRGKKTYMLGVLLAFIELLTSLDIVSITNNQKTSLVIFICALMGMSLRSAINEKK